MSMIEVQINDKETHEYASGITAGDILLNVYGKRNGAVAANINGVESCLLYTSPSPRDRSLSRMPSSA